MTVDFFTMLNNVILITKFKTLKKEEQAIEE